MPIPTFAPVIPYSSPAGGRALIAAGFWMRLGFACLLVAGAATASLVEGSMHALPAMLAIAAGAGACLLCWRRTIAVLEQADAPDDAPAPAAAVAA